MSNDLIPFEDGEGQLPDHLRAQFGGANDDLSGGISGGYATLSYKGRSWKVSEGGTSELILRPDGSGEPATSLELVIISANPNLSKVYYKGGYVEGSDAKPSCYSNDSVRPALDAEEPQSASCAACPLNAWGSRITENGSKGKACSDSRRLAVAPAGDLEHLMLLRVPAATLKDLKAYADGLTRRQAPYQSVVTKVSFDHTVAYPKLVFKAQRWLNAEEAETVGRVMQLESVKQITGAQASRGAPQQSMAETDSAPEVAPPQAQVNKPAPAGVAFGSRAKAAPAPTSAKAVTPKAAPAKAATADKGAFVSPPDVSKAAPAPSKTASKISDANAELDAALADLDDI